MEDHCHARPSSIWSQKEKRIRLRALERNLGSRPCVGGARGWHECGRSRWSGSCRRRRRSRRRSGSRRRKWQRWGRRSSSSPEWPNRAGLPSGHGLGWQGSKVPGYAQRRTHWARSDRIRGCARPAAVGRNAGVAPTVTSGQCATRSDSSKFASGYPRGRLQEAFWRCCAARALWVDPKRLAGSTSGRAPSVRF
jgi:hypothetical protein